MTDNDKCKSEEDKDNDNKNINENANRESNAEYSSKHNNEKCKENENGDGHGNGDDENEAVEELHTVAADPRYQNCNVSRWCYSTFVDYHKCSRLLGEGNPTCEEFQKIYKVICPNDWIRKWEDQLENGTFAANLPEKEEDCS